MHETIYIARARSTVYFCHQMLNDQRGLFLVSGYQTISSTPPAFLSGVTKSTILVRRA